MTNLKTSSLPYKFIWADGQLMVGPGWRKDIHHIHLMQDMGITEIPQNFVSGTFNEDTFHDYPNLWIDESHGTVPSEEQLIELIRQQLKEPEHIGRLVRKPW